MCIAEKPDQGGIISAIAALQADPRPVYAAGSFAGSVCVYSEQERGGGVAIARLSGPRTGVSQLRFLPSDSGGAPWLLAAGGRADGQVFVWDSRQLRQDRPLAVLHRRVENYQRFQFDCDP